MVKDTAAAADYDTAFQALTNAGYTVYAVLPPEIGDGDQVKWSAKLDPGTHSNEFIDDFAGKALAFAEATITHCQDFIIWNEFNAPDTAFLQGHCLTKQAVVASGELLSPFNADHFVAVLHQCRTAFDSSTNPAVRNARIHMGGIQLPPGPAAVATGELLMYLENVYEVWWARGIPKPWSGVNIHIHELRETTQGAADAADLGPLFSTVREVMHRAPWKDTVSTIIAGEVGVSVESQLSWYPSYHDSLQDLVNAVRFSHPVFPEVMFYFAHQDVQQDELFGLRFRVPGVNPIMPGGTTILRDSYVFTLANPPSSLTP